MNWISVFASGAALLAALYHLGFAFERPFTEGEHAIIHVGFAALIVGVDQARRRRGALRVLAIACLVAALAASVYFFQISEELELRFGIGLTTPQVVAGIAIIVAVIILCWMEWGVIIASLAVIGLSYFFFGDNIPGAMRAASHPSFEYAMTFLISSGGTGLYGQVTPISANIIFLFMIFGALLASTGVTRLFMELGNWMGRLLKGGAAVTSVISSALLGTVTGATVANVAITGVFTIPTMKRQGFRAEDAAAMESVASCGGQVLPPVMGAGAFIMAAFLGVSYVDIALQALVPALLFFGSVLLVIAFIVRKSGHIEECDPPDFRCIRGEILPFFAPMATLVYFLMNGYSATTAVVFAIAAIVGSTLLRPSTWRSKTGFVNSLRTIFEGLVSGAQQGAGLAIVIVVISLVAQSLITTALGPKFASALSGLAGGYTFLALLLIMLASLILGCGLPTVAAYTMVAIMMIPALSALGVDPLAAHMFVYYFAVYAAVTPPVATAVIVASRIAETSFWGAAWASMRLMAGPIILPFLFIYHGDILTFPMNSGALLPIFAWLVATVGLQIVTVRHFVGPTSALDIAAAGASAALAFAWIVAGAMPLLAVAVLLLAFVTTLQLRRRSRAAAPRSGAA